MKNHQSGYSLVEVLIVVAILSVIMVTGYRTVSSFTTQAAQTAKAAASAQKAAFDKFIGVLNDRLSQAWTFQATDTTVNGLTGKRLDLFDYRGTNYALVNLVDDGTTFVYQITDLAGTLVPAGAMQDLTYSFVNNGNTTLFRLELQSKTDDMGNTYYVANWKIPPPFYPTASANSLRPLFVFKSEQDLDAQIADYRAKSSTMMQHDLKSYTFNPRAGALR